ncbi:MAG: MCE family protein [Acidimicrobiales bacterium]
MTVSRPRAHLRLAVALVAGVLALAACSVQTATAPTGDLTLFATFDDVQDLTSGHNVQMHNVVIGSVQHIDLVDYRAEVELSIVDGRNIPSGTTAMIRRTSFLGEHYVDLIPPEGFDPEAGPFLEDEAAIVDTDTQPDLEAAVEEGAEVLSAVVAQDFADVMHAVSEGWGGRGPLFNRLIDQTAELLGVFADQNDQIAAAIDGLANLGSQLAPSADRLPAILDDVQTITAATSASRDRLLATVDAALYLISAFDEVIFTPHADTLRSLFNQFNCLFGAIADRSEDLSSLLDTFARFAELAPTAIHNGQILMWAWGRITLEDDPAPLIPPDFGGADDPPTPAGCLVEGATE